MSYQNTFQRYELKYLISRKQKELLQKTFEPYMKPDDYGRSTICNLYYDTPDSLLIRRSLGEPVYKEKLRERSYGVATEDSPVFVELKKKYKSVVYKRRVSVKEREAIVYLDQGIPLPIQNQITREIDYTCEFYGNLEPAVYLSYEREAFYGREDDELRITFDENILWRDTDISLCAAVYGSPILAEGEALMEIKIGSAMPLWLAHLLSQNQIFQTSFSKYGNAYLEMQQRKQYHGGKKYA